MKTYRTEPEGPARNRLFVGVSEYAVADDGQTLVAYGLGACVGIALYDPTSGVGGLAHPMLPRRGGADSPTAGKFVDVVVESLLRETLEAGAAYGAIEGYVVGGADLLDLPDLPREASRENVAVARAELDRLGVPVVGESVGGARGRTVELDAETGTIRVITVAGDDPHLLREPGVSAE